MKPCRKNKKPISWLVLNSLDPEQASSLQDHLRHCPPCRQYRDELLRLKSELLAGDPHFEISASGSFHSRLVARRQATEREPTRRNLPGLSNWLRLNWRLALPALGATAITVLAMSLLHFHREPDTHATVSLPVPNGSVSSQADAIRNSARRATALAPTLSNYETIASESLEKFDDLLNRQAMHGSSSRGPIYTASALVTSKIFE